MVCLVCDADCCLRILQLFNRTIVHVQFRMLSTRFKLKIMPLNVCMVHTLHELTRFGTIVASQNMLDAQAHARKYINSCRIDM